MAGYKSSQMSLSLEISGSSSLSETQSSDWKTIHVYRGGLDVMDYPRQEWYGQVQQDKLIAWLTNNLTKGYFVDLASNDATFLSNTFALERNLEWNGICIEANPIYWDRLAQLRSCQVVGAVVGKTANEEITFNLESSYGGIVGFDNQENSNATRVAYTTKLESLFQTFHVPSTIDYLSLDVEGAEEFIMSAFPFHSYQFRFMTVERPSAGLNATLYANGYHQVKNLVFFNDILYAHESELGPNFNMAALERYCSGNKGVWSKELGPRYRKRVDTTCG